jgi:hypothetical protein
MSLSWSSYWFCPPPLFFSRWTAVYCVFLFFSPSI